MELRSYLVTISTSMLINQPGIDKRHDKIAVHLLPIRSQIIYAVICPTIPDIGLITFIIDHRKSNLSGSIGSPVRAIVDSLMNCKYDIIIFVFNLYFFF